MFGLPDIAGEILYLLSYFYEVKQSQPFTWSELKAWNDVSGYNLAHWEMLTLFKLDRIHGMVISDFERKSLKS